MSGLPRNMNGRGLDYELLGPAERFRLALETGARGDDQERSRLVDGAPMRVYRLTDPAYMNMVDASRELALIIALTLGPRMAELRMLRATREALGGMLAASVSEDVRAGFDDHVTAEVADPAASAAVKEKFTAVEGEVRAEAAAAYTAFSQVCHDHMALDPEDVLAAHLGPLAAQLGLDQLDGAKPDKDQQTYWRELFAAAWRRHVDRD